MTEQQTIRLLQQYFEPCPTFNDPLLMTTGQIDEYISIRENDHDIDLHDTQLNECGFSYGYLDIYQEEKVWFVQKKTEEPFCLELSENELTELLIVVEQTEYDTQYLKAAKARRSALGKLLYLENLRKRKYEG